MVGMIFQTRSSEEGGIPSTEEFDLSIREVFLRDFDLLEQAVLKARNQTEADITDEILDTALKNGRQK